MTTDEPAPGIVVAGASAGGVDALAAMVAGLPADLPAAVLLVMHVPEAGRSSLAQILDRRGPLPVTDARNGETVRAGRVYVAVNDRHLLVKGTRILLSDAPRQNRLRPSVDALFRSAARWWGPHAAGVVLSGFLDDGAAGAAAIHEAGGAVVVQDPKDAFAPAMPEATLAVVPTAAVVTAEHLGAYLAPLMTRRAAGPGTASDDLIRETEMLETPSTGAPSGVPGSPVGLSCPDCSGAMNVVQTGAAVHYVCHVGHSWSPHALATAKQEKVEEALWTAVSMLEEQAAVFRQLAERAEGQHAALTIRHQLSAADDALRAASVIRMNFPDLLPNAAEG